MSATMLGMNTLVAQATEHLKAGDSTDAVALFLQEQGIDAPTAYGLVDALQPKVQQEKVQPAPVAPAIVTPQPAPAPVTEPVKQPAGIQQPAPAVVPEPVALSPIPVAEKKETHPAVEYISTLFEPDDRLCVALIDPNSKKVIQDFRSVGQISQPEYLQRLLVRNQQCNVYVGMNPILAGHNNRTKEDIADIRTVYLDLDSDAVTKLEAITESESIPKPTFVLRSSDDKYQVIWRIAGVSKPDQESLLSSLIAEFGGDPACCDCSRVLRLPGFANVKYANRPVVEIVQRHSGISRRDDFKLSSVAAHESKPLSLAIDGPEIPYGSHDVELTRIAGKLRQELHLDEDGIYDVLVKMDTRCTGHGDDFDDMCRNIAHSIGKKPIVDTRVLHDGKDVQLAAQEKQQADAAPSWLAPEPLDDGLTPVLPFEPTFLPLSIRSWVVDVAERMSIPLDFVGICALVALAGVIGRRAFVYPKAKDKEWKESISLSGAVVAQSGKTKTPAWKAITNVVVENDMDWRDRHTELMLKYKDNLKIWQEAQKKQKQTPEQGQGTPEQGLDEFRVEGADNLPAKPEEPAGCRCCLLNDATPEAMHSMMEANPEGLLYYRDELASWVAELDKKEREVERGMFLAAMNGNDAYAIDRVGRGRIFAIMCVSLFGSFQPDRLKEFLSKAQNVSDGLIPRFPLLVWPDDFPGRFVDRPPNEQAKNDFRMIVRRLAALKAESVSLHFSPEAQLIYNSWYDDLLQKIASERQPGKQSHLAKYKGGLPKIAGLLQLIDLVAVGDVTGNRLIDAEHLNMAIMFLEYLESHMHRVYDCIKTPAEIAELSLAEHIQMGDLKSSFTVRDIKRKHWLGLKDNDYIECALETLVDWHWLQQKFDSQDHYWWEINPALISDSGSVEPAKQPRMGRPTKSGRAMTAAERVAEYRRRHAA